MKKIRYIAAALCLLLSLSACSYNGDTVRFYYLHNSEWSYIAPTDNFYTTELRDVSGHTEDLRYLLNLYLRGPLDDTMRCPFPEGTRLVQLESHAQRLYIELSEEFAQLRDIDLTNACACISLTCFQLSDANQITILTPATDTSSAVEVTMRRSSLTLSDTLTSSGQSQ